jgi:hypothetical protein
VTSPNKHTWHLVVLYENLLSLLLRVVILPELLGSLVRTVAVFGPDVVITGFGGAISGDPSTDGKLIIEAPILIRLPGDGRTQLGLNISYLTNRGTITVPSSTLISLSNVTNEGTINVAGAANVFSDLNEAAGSQLAVTLAGTASGQFGVFKISGKAILTGALSVTIAPGFVPKVGDRFRFLTSQSLQGVFDQIVATGLPAGLVLTADYSQDGVTLVVQAE